MAFLERTWERHHTDGMCERIIQTADAWCEGYIVERGIRSAAGRGTSRDTTGYVMRRNLVHRGHQCSAACDDTWREIARTASHSVAAGARVRRRSHADP
jgi:hypothetical protein